MLTFHSERSAQFACFRVSGPCSVDNYALLVEQTASITRTAHDSCMLMDLREVSGRLRFTDQLYIGGLMGLQLAHLKRLAVLVRHEPSSYHAAKVASHEGINLRYFTVEEEARSWLLSAMVTRP